MNRITIEATRSITRTPNIQHDISLFFDIHHSLEIFYVPSWQLPCKTVVGKLLKSSQPMRKCIIDLVVTKI
ncbi:hypothetical protein QQP08_020847 [Theobroma cacao]|nr:hypothetical protein QQP08_020847 [Theobroma cacao]